jgi:hypothetical protein
VLVGAADICRDDLQDDGVVDLFAGGILHFGEVDGLNFNLVLSEKNYSSVFSHFFIATSLRVTVKLRVRLETASAAFDALQRKG